MARASVQAHATRGACPQPILKRPPVLHPHHASATGQCSRSDASTPISACRPCWPGRSRNVTVQSAAQEPTTSSRADPVINISETVRGCRTVLAELKGLDFPRSEVQLYFASAVKLPRNYNARGATMERASAALQQLLRVDEDGDPLPASHFKDPEALALVQAVLSEIWRWRRRGGGMNTEDTARAHQAALQEIQNIQPVEDIDRMTSSVLDSLPNISDKDKADMSQGMQSMALGAFQGAVWGSMIFGVLAFVAFNFLRAG